MTINPAKWARSIFLNTKNNLLPGASLPWSRPTVESSRLSDEQLQRCYQSGLEVQNTLNGIENEGQTLIDVILNGKTHRPWDHFPKQGGVLDQRTHSQYFYHTHDDYTGEHGHFHTFVYHKRKLVHLVVIGIDDRGKVNKLYTYNRWGPGDTYYPADKLKEILSKFHIRPNQGFNGQVHSFINNILVTYQETIEDLFDQRDATFEKYREQHDGASPYEDRSLEITSTIDVRIDTQMKTLKSQLSQSSGGRPPHGESFEIQQKKADGGGPPRRPQEQPPRGEVQTEDEPLFSSLKDRSIQQLETSYNAGEKLLSTLESIQNDNKNLIEILLNGAEHESWSMYPWKSGIIDQKNKSQYFYHSHPQTSEHGHFHTFYHHKNDLVHLVVIALDNASNAIELLTVNRWVTGDFYLPAKKIKGFLSRFQVQSRSFDKRVHQFVRNIMVLYQPEIKTLLDQRDHTFKCYRNEHGGTEPYEDRALEITSSLEIDITKHIAQLKNEIEAKKAT